MRRLWRAPAIYAAVVISLFWPAAVEAGDVRTGLQFDSHALKQPLSFSLYLPDAYAAEPERRFPVIYLLHGYGANDREWLERGKAGTVLDQLIQTGDVPPVIAVMPDGAKSWYVDSADLGGPGDYESAIARDLLGHIENRYRAMPDRRGRAIAGLSMGGYGALRLAFFHPERFIAVASLSGALYETAGIPGVDQPAAEALEKAAHWYRGAYGRPFNVETYIARSPFSRITDLKRMEKPPHILITAGDDDYFKFYEGSAALFVALRRAGLPAELRIDDGGHDWKLWRKQFPQVVRFLSNAMRAESMN